MPITRIKGRKKRIAQAPDSLRVSGPVTREDMDALNALRSRGSNIERARAWSDREWKNFIEENAGEDSLAPEQLSRPWYAQQIGIAVAEMQMEIEAGRMESALEAAFEAGWLFREVGAQEHPLTVRGEKVTTGGASGGKATAKNRRAATAKRKGAWQFASGKHPELWDEDGALLKGRKYAEALRKTLPPEYRPSVETLYRFLRKRT